MRSFKLQAICGLLPGVLCQEQVILAADNGSRAQPLNVAIIGAGSAGSSSAYHLAKFATEAGLPINITVFDRNSYVGGRSTTVNVYHDTSENPVELGASIFVQVNQILVDAVEEFGLSIESFRSQTVRKAIPGADLAVWDGEKLVLTQYGASKWWDTAKLFWKYGLAPLKTINLMKATVGKFLKMYDEPVFPFESISQAAQDVGILAVTAATGEQFMVENGIGGDFGHDIVQASTRVNYAQNLRFIHGLEAMVCMATDGAMAVRDGNWQIFDNMLTASRATKVLGKAVTKVERDSKGKFQLTGKTDSEENSKIMDAAFDSVILAAPFHQANLIFDPPLDHTPDDVPYVELHVTLFTSPHLLSPTYFGLQDSDSAPKVILTTLPKDSNVKPGPEGCGEPRFWSISLLRPVVNPETQAGEYLYKIFSPTSVKPKFLNSILNVAKIEDEDVISTKDVTWMYQKVWQSYPYEYPRVTFESCRLGQMDDGKRSHGNLWYTAGMESFISTMETSALMGKNIARLMINQALRTNT